MRPLTEWDSLTDTDRNITKLVAEGSTNQQVADQLYISIHTVAYHLRQVFRKLGISSRVELTRRAGESHGRGERAPRRRCTGKAALGLRPPEESTTARSDK